MKRVIKSSTSTSVFTSWNEAYRMIEAVINLYMDPDLVDDAVSRINDVFSQDPNWREAYRRYLDTPEVG